VTARILVAALLAALGGVATAIAATQGVPLAAYGGAVIALALGAWLARHLIGNQAVRDAFTTARNYTPSSDLAEQLNASSIRSKRSLTGKATDQQTTRGPISQMFAVVVVLLRHAWAAAPRTVLVVAAIGAAWIALMFVPVPLLTAAVSGVGMLAFTTGFLTLVQLFTDDST
jgi:hypothetical protein